jgi:hypothetical protein
LTFSTIESDATNHDCLRMDLGFGFGIGDADVGGVNATIGSVGDTTIILAGGN